MNTLPLIGSPIIRRRRPPGPRRRQAKADKSTKIFLGAPQFETFQSNYFWKEAFPVISHQQTGDRLKSFHVWPKPSGDLIKDLTESQNKLAMFVKTRPQMELR
jgi:hypothetical protein